MYQMLALGMHIEVGQGEEVMGGFQQQCKGMNIATGGRNC